MGGKRRLLVGAFDSGGGGRGGDPQNVIEGGTRGRAAHDACAVCVGEGWGGERDE